MSDDTPKEIATEIARYGKLGKFGWVTADGLTIYPGDDPDAEEFDLS